MRDNNGVFDSSFKIKLLNDSKLTRYENSEYISVPSLSLDNRTGWCFHVMWSLLMEATDTMDVLELTISNLQK